VAQKSGRSCRPVRTAVRKIELDERMNGNGELTETENVIFYVSYGVLTEFLRMNVICTYFCNGNGLTAQIRNAGNQAYRANHYATEPQCAVIRTQSQGGATINTAQASITSTLFNVILWSFVNFISTLFVFYVLPITSHSHTHLVY